MPIGPARMPLMDHLGELRMRLVRIVVCLLVAAVVFYMATPTMGNFLIMPIQQYLPSQLTALDPFEAFSVRFQLAVWAALVATSPVIIWQLLAFFLPALKPKERKWFIPTFAAAVALFIIGTVFCYAIILNPAFQWLTDQAMGLGYVAPRMSSYVDIIIKFELGFGGEDGDLPAVAIMGRPAALARNGAPFPAKAPQGAMGTWRDGGLCRVYDGKEFLAVGRYVGKEIKIVKSFFQV